MNKKYATFNVILVILSTLAHLLPILLLLVAGYYINNRTGLTSSLSLGILALVRILAFTLAFYVIIRPVRNSINVYLINNNYESIYYKAKIIKNKNKGIFVLLYVTYTFVLILSGIFILQRQFTLIPNHSVMDHRNVITKQEFESIIIEGKSGTYTGFGNVEKDLVKPTVIFFTGNHQNSSNLFLEFDAIGIFETYEDYNFFIIDYPGYGINLGKANNASMHLMSLETYDYISKLNYVDSNNITIIGYSIGTNIATYVGANRSIENLVLIAPYNSMKDTFNSFLPIFYGPFKYLVNDKFDTAGIINKVSAKILIIYSTEDEVIKPKNTEKLIGNITDKDKLEISKVSYLKHNGLGTNLDIHKYISEYIEVREAI